MRALKTRRLLLAPVLAGCLLLLILMLGVHANLNAADLLTDSGFESGSTTYWTPSPGTTIFTVTNSPVYSGSWAASVGSASNSTKAIKQDISGITPGNRYTLSGYGYKNDPNVTAVRLRLAWYAAADCSGSQLETVDSNEIITDTAAYIFLTTGPVDAPPASQCAQVRAQMQPVSSTLAVAYFDQLSFIADNPPTATPTGTPAPPPAEGVIINEVAWAGTGASSSDEWLELHNVTTQTISLAGWVITGASGLNIALSGDILPQGYFLLERTDDNAVSDLPADQIYSGNLGNSGDSLFLSNGVALVDSANGDSGSWPGGSASPDYASMERIDPLAPDTDANWTSNDQIHRNGLDADGNPINGTPKQANSTTYPPPPTPTPTPPPAAEGVIINEVAWGGTDASSSDEWLELHNVTTQTISLAGWVITGASGLNIILSGDILPQGYFLLERTDDNAISDLPADQIYSGNLGNSGDSLFLSNGVALVDSANGDSGSWPGGSASPDYASMERIDPLAADADTNWASNDQIHRNGLDADGNPVNGTPKQANSTTYPPPPVIPLLISEILYDGTTPSTEGDEFVELCNATTETANLSGYKIGDEESAGAGEGMYRFPNNLLLAPGGCLVIAKNAAHFTARFQQFPDFEVVVSGDSYVDTFSVPNLARYSAWGGGVWALTNHSDEMLLLGPDDRLLDSAAWRDGDYQSVALTGTVSAAEPFSLQRVWPLDSNWMAADFFRDTPSPGSVTPLPSPAIAPPISLPGGMAAYFGSLESDSTFSTGSGPPNYLFAQAGANGWRFLGLTDPGESISAPEWEAIQTWAAEATIANQFIALPGVKWQNNERGLNIFGLDGPVSPSNPSTASLTDLFAYLATRPNTIAQFNDSDADTPPLNAGAAPRIALQALASVTDPNSPDIAPLIASWQAGWRVAPALNVAPQAPDWSAGASPRTGIVAPALTEDDILAALQARRVFAASDGNFVLAMRGEQTWMGSELPEAGPTQFEIYVIDPDAEGATLTLYDRTVPLLNAVVTAPFTWTPQIHTLAGHFYWAQAVQTDGDIAVTAPIWIAGTPDAETVTLNEILPAPYGTDWDGDGAADSEDEWIELLNPGAAPVDLSGWYLQDEGGATHTFGPAALIQPGEYKVVYRAESGIALNNSGDALSLYRPDASLADNIPYAADPGDDIAVCRHPENGEIHTRCIPTPGAANIVLPPLAPLSLKIYDAKKVTEGAWVRVAGYVTVAPGVFGKNTFYLQDDSHGIRVKLPGNHGLWFDEGTYMEVTGYLDLYYNEWEIDIKDKSDIRRLEGKRLVKPLPIGGGLLREGYEGLLVQLTVYPTAFKKGASHFWVEDETGLAYVYIYRKTGIKRKNVTLGAPVTIVGIAGQRTQTQPPFDGYRLYPRSPNDIIQQAPLASDAAAAIPANWPSVLPETGERR